MSASHFISNEMSQTVCTYFMFGFSISEKFRESGDYWLFFNRTNLETTSCAFSIANDPLPAELRKRFSYDLCGTLSILTTFMYFLRIKYSIFLSPNTTMHLLVSVE